MKIHTFASAPITALFIGSCVFGLALQTAPVNSGTEPAENAKTVVAVEAVNYDGLLKQFSSAQKKGDYPAALAVATDLLKLSQRSNGFLHQRTLKALNLTALSHYRMGQFQAAERLYRRILAIDDFIPGSDPATRAVHLNNLGNLLRAKGDLNAAEPMLRQALEIGAKTIGTQHTPRA